MPFAFYAFRCLFATKSFVDQYGMGDGAAIMTRFFWINICSFSFNGYICWICKTKWIGKYLGFFNLIFLQNAAAFIFAIWSHRKGNLGVNSKTSVEGIIAPGVLTLLSAILCYGLADKIYT